MPDATPVKPRWLDFIPAITLALVVGGSLTVGGGYISDVKDLKRRLESVEADLKIMRAVDARLARIEVRQEMMNNVRPSPSPEHPQ